MIIEEPGDERPDAMWLWLARDRAAESFRLVHDGEGVQAQVLGS
jgi:hypothetical protein